MTSRPDLNPYDAPTSTTNEIPRRPRWIRNLIVLNTALLAFPLLLTGFVYLVLLVVLMQANGGVYAVEFTGFSIDSWWPLLAYLLIPNATLLGWMTIVGYRSIPNTELP